MWSEVKSGKVCWVPLVCGLLMTAAVVTAAVLGYLLVGEHKPSSRAAAVGNGTIPEDILVALSTPSGLSSTESFGNTSVTAGTFSVTPPPLPTTGIDVCIKNPCQHGTCVNKDGGFTCTCSPGWTGQSCQQDIDECTGNPCQHGTCENKDGGYKCTCSYGWTGPNCQQGEDCHIGDGSSYRGTIAVTETGRTCQRWDSQAPHGHSRTPANYPSSGLAQNFCRNPDGWHGAWCYTTDPDKRWELCGISDCDGNLCKDPCPIGRCVNKGCTCSPLWTAPNCHKHI